MPAELAGYPTGVIRGKVEIAGPVPPRRRLDTRADPFCANTAIDDESLLVDRGKLANVHIRLSSPLPWSFPAPPSAAILRQKSCRYTPRVMSAMVGQQIQIENDDGTLHNVHAYRGASTIFNQAQPPGLPPIVKKDLGNKPDVIKLKCDVHPWMTGHIVLADNPYVAVSAADGTFAIATVPAGKHKLTAWHERAGTQTVEVIVPPGGTADVSLSFSAGRLGP